ncbi:UNVERIFIED_CONTAM: hypothetical protein GTU68_043565, partial [Idotea baltica]|nr:hypothetical protein [Idotea baltica]
SLIPQFGGLLYTLLAFVVALSVIVAVHEYGHYIVGRWSGIHAEVFSLGFGPVLYSRMDKRGTRWQIAALPFGGYVKFLGDANAASGKDSEAMETAERDPAELRRTMHGAPLWARTATVAAGPIFNFVMSIFVFSAIVLTRGPYLFPPYVSQVAPRSAAMDIGLESGDVITAIDGAPIFAFDQLKSAVESSDGRVLLLDVWRQGETLEFALAPRRTDEPQADGGFVTHWRIGIAGGMAFLPATERAGLGEAVIGGSVQTMAIISSSLSGLWHMVTGAISTCNMSGPIGIAETSGAMASQGAQSFIWFIAVLSTAVGLLNLFPIPALDGGHLVFYAYEAVAGKPPSDGALRILMAIGLSLILSLMVFALGNDLFC